jgi:hypothetical protein
VVSTPKMEFTREIRKTLAALNYQTCFFNTHFGRKIIQNETLNGTENLLGSFSSSAHGLPVEIMQDPLKRVINLIISRGGDRRSP